MNLILSLFLTFLKIGAVSFGGGYGMIALLEEEVLAHGWMTEEELLNFIAVSESTPGPIAINMATFVGSSQAGILGSAAATLGVVLPSFVIILMISAFLKNFLQYKPVKAFLLGVRPAVTGMILATALTMMLSVVVGFDSLGSEIVLSWKEPILLALVVGADHVCKRLRKKALSPILLILCAAALGILFFGVLR